MATPWPHIYGTRIPYLGQSTLPIRQVTGVGAVQDAAKKSWIHLFCHSLGSLKKVEEEAVGFWFDRELGARSLLRICRQRRKRKDKIYHAMRSTKMLFRKKVLFPSFLGLQIRLICWNGLIFSFWATIREIHLGRSDKIDSTILYGLLK